MKDLIAREHRHLLWQDELGSDFLLLKYTEIYRYSEDVLRLHMWNKRKLLQLRKIGGVLDIMRIDEPFLVIDVKVSILPQLIALGAFRRRPKLKGRWVRDKERILAHKILPYRPTKLYSRKKT